MLLALQNLMFCVTMLYYYYYYYEDILSSNVNSLDLSLFIVNIRAGQFLGILVVPRYWNQTIPLSSKFQRNDIIEFRYYRGFIESRNSF